MSRTLKVPGWMLLALGLMLGRDALANEDARADEWQGMTLLEARPAPRLGGSVEHAGFGQERWLHTLSLGLGVRQPWQVAPAIEQTDALRRAICRRRVGL